MTASLALKILSGVVCLIILVGLAYRRRKKMHAGLMMTAFVIDVAMVLYIELTRQAIATAIHPPHPFVRLHVTISITVMILYVFQIVTGMRRYKTGSRRDGHRLGAVLFVIFRLGNFVTSLWVEQFIPR